MTLDASTSGKDTCKHCHYSQIRFIEFGRVWNRLNDRQIVVTEIWMCRRCRRRFERPGI